jgi:hypothetical protein
MRRRQPSLPSALEDKILTRGMDMAVDGWSGWELDAVNVESWLLYAAAA